MTNKLKQYRKVKGWTQADLAAVMGCSKHAIRKWEQSGNIPPMAYKLFVLLLNKDNK